MTSLIFFAEDVVVAQVAATLLGRWDCQDWEYDSAIESALVLLSRAKAQREAREQKR